MAYALIGVSAFMVMFGYSHIHDRFMPIKLAGFASMFTGLALGGFTYFIWDIIK